MFRHLGLQGLRPAGADRYGGFRARYNNDNDGDRWAIEDVTTTIVNNNNIINNNKNNIRNLQANEEKRKNGVIYGLILGVALPVVIVLFCIFGSKNNSNVINSINTNNNINNNDGVNNNGVNNYNEEKEKEEQGQEEELLSKKIASMSIEERMDMYRTAFVENHQQMNLDPSWLVWLVDDDDDDDNDGDYNDGNEEDEDNEEDDDITMVLQSTRSSFATSAIRKRPSDDIDSGHLLVPNGTNDGDLSRASSSSKTSIRSIRHPRYQSDRNSKGNGNNGNKNNKNNNHSMSLVSGLCVICLDSMVAGDLLVFGAHPSCPHLFHRDCMVSFLAHNTLRRQERHTRCPAVDAGGRRPRPPLRLGTRNPCPTCRKNFVRLRPPTAADHDGRVPVVPPSAAAPVARPNTSAPPP